MAQNRHAGTLRKCRPNDCLLFIIVGAEGLECQEYFKRSLNSITVLSNDDGIEKSEWAMKCERLGKGDDIRKARLLCHKSSLS